jgi:hypothetical protein
MEQPDRNDKPLYNSSMIRSYVMLIKSRYNFININELLNYAGIEPFQVDDQGHWFAQKQINFFHKKLQELTKNPDIAREAGSFGTAPETMGNLRSYLLSLGEPVKAYERISGIAPKFTRSSDYKSKKISSNSVEITVTPMKGTREEPFQCKNRIGTFEGFFKVFDRKPPRIEHPECMFKNGEKCRYIISWDKSLSTLFRQIRNYTAIIFALLCSASPFLFGPKVFLTTLAISGCIFTFLSWLIEKSKNKKLTKYQDTNTQAYDQLADQININYENSLMVKEVGEVLSTEVDLDGIIQQVVKILTNRLNYDRGVVMLADKDQTRLMYCVGFGYTDKQMEYWDEKEFFHLNRPGSEGIFVVSFKKQVPILVEDINKIEDTLSNGSKELVEKLDVKSLICCPIIYANKSIGILAAESCSPKKPPVQRDVNILMGVTSQIGIGINYIQTRDEYSREKEAMIELKAKEDLTARAIHNIRNPIEITHTYLDLIKMKHAPDPDLLKKLDKMELHITRVEELATGFLRYLKPINERIEKFDLNDLMKNDIIPRFQREKDKQKQIDFDFSLHEISADKSGIKYIIEEIIQNGFKHNATAVNIKNRLSDNKVVFIFENNGDPVPKESHDIIFTPFKTSDPMGTGLGMANVKRIAEDHKGNIWYDKSFEKGAHFIIEFPEQKEF